jgi:hypothetical protein
MDLKLPYLSINILLVILMTASCSSYGQDYFQEGLALEKEFKIEAALEKYEQAILQNPENGLAFYHASRMLSNIGGNLPLSKKELKKEKYQKAKAFALTSIQFLPENPHTHLAYTIALGLLSEISGTPREKIVDAKIIKEEGETIIRLNPTMAEGYFILGKWNFELSKLNWFEQMACQVFFGGLPEGFSMEAAKENFEKANQLQPNTILFLFGEASVLHYQGKLIQAKKLLERAIGLPLQEPDDAQRKLRCQQLLKQIKNEQ